MGQEGERAMDLIEKEMGIIGGGGDVEERELGRKYKGLEEEREPARITLRPWAV